MSCANEMWEQAEQEVYKRMLKEHPEYIAKIKNPTEEMQMHAILHNWKLIQHINKPTKTVRAHILVDQPEALDYLNETKEVVHVQVMKLYYKNHKKIIDNLKVFEDETYRIY